MHGAHARAADRCLVEPVAAAPPWPRPTRRRRSRSRPRTYQPAAADRAEWAAVIDLRSDTVTRPTPGMRAAIAAAVVGDEQMREDPTVNELQERVAELLGQERALFLPDRDDGEPDRPQAARPPGRRARRRAALPRPGLRVRRRRRARRAAHASGCPGVGGPAHGRPRCARRRRPWRTSSTSAPPCSCSRTPTTSPAGASGRSTSSMPSSPPRGPAGSACTWTARGC